MSDEFGLSKHDYTLVAFDLPAYGRSKELLSTNKDRKEDYNRIEGRRIKKFNNMPTLEYFEFCSKVGFELMKLLGYKTYSICGWNDGARIACLLAINYQSRVNSLLLWGFVPIMDKHSCEAVSRTRDTGTWDEKILSYYTDVYGEKNFSKLWKEYVDYIISTLELTKHFDIREQLKQIKCPTMILYGESDSIVDYKSHVEPLHMQIYDSDIVRLPDLAHNIHQANPLKFNFLLNTFMTSVHC